MKVSTSSSARRVVITGMGAVTPIGTTLNEIESSLRESKSGVRPIALFDASDLPVRFAGQALAFKPEDHLDAKEVRRNDRFIQMCLAASDMAVRDAGLDKDQLVKAGVAIGVGIGGLSSIEDASVELASSGPRRVSPFFVPSILANLASGQVSIRYGARGPNFAISSACASGSQAIGQAYREIQAGRGEVWIAGGAEAPISRIGIAGFAAARALSKRNDAPEYASRPFDQSRDGFVLGEGAATVIVESLDSARRRGAKIYAEIVGFGIASDGYHVTEPDPNGEGAYLAMRESLEDSGLSCGEIDYVNAHATGTDVGDRVEAIAMKRLYEKESESLLVSSTKSLTGHACGAAGALETIFCTLMIERGFIAPSFNLDALDPDFVFRAPTREHLSVRPDTVMNNSFGFGGINTSLILKRWNESELIR